MKIVSAAILMAFGLCLVTQARADICGAVAGNIVANCGFETGDFSKWTVSGNQQGGFGGNYWGVDSSNPDSGAFGAYLGVQGNPLGTVSAPITLSQTLTVLPAEYYQITFFLNQNGPSDAPGYTNYFDVLFNGVLLSNATNAPNSGGYQEWSFLGATGNGPANPNSGILSFSFQNDSDFFFFDDVSVVAKGMVPEPATGLLIAPVLGGLWWAARRRKAARSRS